MMSRPSVVVASDDDRKNPNLGRGSRAITRSDTECRRRRPRATARCADGARRSGRAPRPRAFARRSGASARRAPPAGAPGPPDRPPGITCGQPLCHTSNGIACIVHRTLPVSMLTAIIALAVFGVPEKALPVPKYSARRLRSRTGVTQMPAPAGGEQVLASRVLADGHRLFGNRVRLPELLAGGCIERHNQAAECTARVVSLTGLGFLERRDRHVHASVVQHRRAGDPRERMRIRLHLPDHLSGARIERVRLAVDVAEENGHAI